VVTQTVQVANGLFNVPLPFDPIAMGDGSVRWLNIGVRPSSLPAVQFTPLTRLPLFGVGSRHKWLVINPAIKKVCTTEAHSTNLAEAVIRGGGCSGRVSII
jgi:hypothetical protein